MNPKYLKLDLDKPVTIALKYPAPKPVKGFHGPELRWILINDQALYTPVEVQQQIAGLKIKAGQPGNYHFDSLSA